jgi:hypothetical protein
VCYCGQVLIAMNFRALVRSNRILTHCNSVNYSEHSVAYDERTFLCSLRPHSLFVL